MCRVLVIANEAVDGADLRRTLPTMGRPRCSSSLPPSARESASGSPTSTRPGAAPRHGSSRSLHGLDGGGIAVAGSIGDSEPLQAIADGLRVFEADEIVLVTHSEEEAHWVEHDLVDRARKHFPELEITHLVAGPRRLVPPQPDEAAARISIAPRAMATPAATSSSRAQLRRAARDRKSRPTSTTTVRSVLLFAATQPSVTLSPTAASAAAPAPRSVSERRRTAVREGPASSAATTATSPATQVIL